MVTSSFTGCAAQPPRPARARSDKRHNENSFLLMNISPLANGCSGAILIEDSFLCWPPPSMALFAGVFPQHRVNFAVETPIDHDQRAGADQQRLKRIDHRVV